MANNSASAYRYKSGATGYLPIELNLSNQAADMIRRIVYKAYLQTDSDTEERILSRVLNELDQVLD